MSGLDNLRDVAASLDEVPGLIRAALPSEDSVGKRFLLAVAANIEYVAPALSAAADAIEREAYAYWWRRHEKMWRTVGKFDSADIARQFADSIESGEAHRPPRCRLKLEALS